jgi:ABC-2 type transport system permease protein
MPSVWKAWSFFKRDLLTDFSYKLSFLLQALDVLLAVAAFFFLSRGLGDRNPDGYDAFSFILVGMAVNGYMTTCLVCFAQGVRGNQFVGTLKAVLSTTTSPRGFLLYSAVYPFMRAGIDAAIYLLGGMLFGMSLARMNLFGALLMFLASMVAFSSIGILSATFTMLFKKGDPLLWLVGGLSWLLGGVFYPIEVLPSFLQHLSRLLPITHALEGMRAVLLGGADISEIAPQLYALGIFASIVLPLSLLAFSEALRTTRMRGSLGHY